MASTTLPKQNTTTSTSIQLQPLVKALQASTPERRASHTVEANHQNADQAAAYQATNQVNSTSQPKEPVDTSLTLRSKEARPLHPRHHHHLLQSANPPRLSLGVW